MERRGHFPARCRHLIVAECFVLAGCPEIAELLRELRVAGVVERDTPLEPLRSFVRGAAVDLDQGEIEDRGAGCRLELECLLVGVPGGITETARRGAIALCRCGGCGLWF